MNFDCATVLDAMDPRVLTCAADAPLVLVAHVMATERVHCVVVEGTPRNARGWAVVSDLDLVAAGAGGLDERTAGRSAASEVLTVTPGDSLTRAAALMVAHETSFLIVVDPASDRALGVLSTLDLARAMASAHAV